MENSIQNFNWTALNSSLRDGLRIDAEASDDKNITNGDGATVKNDAAIIYEIIKIRQINKTFSIGFTLKYLS